MSLQEPTPTTDNDLRDKPGRASRTPGERMCLFIERYIIVPEGRRVGQKIHLEDFQRRFILECYDNPHGTRRAILSMGRKNGKTSTIAALALGHIVGPAAIQNGQVVSGALSRDQAALVYGLAEKMILMSPQLLTLAKPVPSTKSIQSINTGSRYRALAAEGATAFGLSPNVIILDELGQIKGPSHLFVEALVTSQGAHDNPMQFVISTQAPTDGDLLSIWIDDALKGTDKHTICHLYAADPGCDLMDPKGWYAANPGLGTIRSEADLRQQMEQAERLPSQENSCRNLLLNQRIQRIAPFLTPSVWKRNAGPLDMDLFTDGRPVYGGLDLSSRQDLTSLVLTTVADDGHIHQYAIAWTPADTATERSQRDRVPYDVWLRQGNLRGTPGQAIGYEYLAAQIGEICEGMNVVEIAYDRWRIDILQAELARHGIVLPLEPFGQGYKDMSPAVDEFEGYALEGYLRHGDNPVYTMCITNSAIETDPAGNRKVTKAKSHGRVDVVVASLMSIGSMRRKREAAVDISSLIG